jgi:hypothetical protein
LSAKIHNIKLFEFLHNEKPSPLFLTLAKSSKNENLQCIRDKQGRQFLSNKEREKHIVEFFADINRKPTGTAPVDYSRCIEDFLGEEILSHPIVTNSKLTLQEKTDLDSPLTIGELDESLNNCNLKLAPGADGFSNKRNPLTFTQNSAGHPYNL